MAVYPGLESTSAALKGGDFKLLKGAEAVYFFLPGSYRLGRASINPVDFLDDHLPAGAIPFAVLVLDRVPGAIVGGRLLYWPVFDAQQGLLDRVREDVDRAFKPAVGHPRIRFIQSEPKGLVYWHESANRKIVPSHLAFPAADGVQFDLAGGASSVFYPVALIEHFGSATVFSERYLRDPERYHESDPRRARLIDFHNAVENFGRKVVYIQASPGERKIAAA